MTKRNKILKKSKKGVALFYFLMVLGVMLGFLMLVVNSGMIIYQKIRLQTTVDLASYAGAAVQASYLGNGSSGKDSIQAINTEILKRYVRLTKELSDLNKTPIPWYGINPIDLPFPAGMAACMAACASSNHATSQLRVIAYQSAARDLEKLREKANRILSQMSQASKKAAEATIRLNIPDLSIENDGVSALLSQTTDKVEEVVQTNKTSSDFLSKKKNAVLSFSSEKGMYLANVVASVPHSFVYYGPLCGSLRNSDITAYKGVDSYYYCQVNGQGGVGSGVNAGGGKDSANSREMAYAMAFAAFTRSMAPPEASGNIGTIDSISDSKMNAIRIHFIQNAHKPGPLFVSAAEWYPTNGSFMNLENSLGASGSLFPKQTRLVAVSAAEPFGGSLVGSAAPNFGVRLSSIRKLLLDPRLITNKKDYPGLFDYMQSLAPMDQSGRPTETAEDVVRRFLH